MNKNTKGKIPIPRIGHTMCYLSHLHALLIVGGRNDEQSVNSNSPFLNDIHLYLFEQESWTEVKYMHHSNKLEKICNHTMAVIVSQSNNNDDEK